MNLVPSPLPVQGGVDDESTTGTSHSNLGDLGSFPACCALAIKEGSKTVKPSKFNRWCGSVGFTSFLYLRRLRVRVLYRLLV